MINLCQQIQTAFNAPLNVLIQNDKEVYGFGNMFVVYYFANLLLIKNLPIFGIFNLKHMILMQVSKIPVSTKIRLYV